MLLVQRGPSCLALGTHLGCREGVLLLPLAACPLPASGAAQGCPCGSGPAQAAARGLQQMPAKVFSANAAHQRNKGKQETTDVQQTPKCKCSACWGYACLCL